jgi:predicted nucleic acid-binding protein
VSIVVADTSVISNLALIGGAKFLPAIYGKVIVPDKVWGELSQGAELHERMRFLRQVEWLEVRAVAQSQVLRDLSKEVDEGEAEAIALALELKADLLLVDDATGRAAALRHGLQIVGLLGVLIRAKEKGLIDHVADWIEELRCHTSFRMSDALVNRVLTRAGEIP